MHVVIAGGTGFVGRRLASLLLVHRHQVTILTHSDEIHATARLERSPELVGKVQMIPYQDYHGEGDILVNLAGASFGSKAITQRRLTALLESRMKVLDFFMSLETLPKVFFQASGVSVYANSKEQQDENAPTSGQGEIADLARTVEAKAQELNEKAKFERFYILRFGLILHRSGGFIQKAMQVPPFTVIQSDNKIPFIEVNDAAQAILFLIISPQIPSGPINLTSPNTATLKEILKCCFKHSSLPPIPIITGLLRFGDKRIQILKADQIVIPKILLDNGFKFFKGQIKDID